MSRQRWAGIGVAVYGALVAAVLLAPFSVTGLLDAFSGWVRDGLGVTAFGSGWIEFGANILMFVPLGFLLTLLLPRAWQGFLLALALSVLAELVQEFLPARHASLRDVLANGAGAVVGAAVAWAALRVTEARARRRADAAASARPVE
jgi:glycopeptide antibiotics resistance protein